MKTLLINVVPMNSGTGVGLNTLATFDESEYNSATDRKVLFYDPLLSKFKLRNVNAHPYIEPCIMGIKQGDVFEVEFEALAVGGKDITLNIQLGDLVDSGGSGLTATAKQSNEVKINHEDYRKYKVNCMVTASFNANMKGVFFNLRLATVNTEVLIRNLNIKCKTSNELLNIGTNFTTYQSKTDFENAIVNNMQTKNPFVDYLNAYKSYIKGETVADNTGLQVNSTANGVTGIFREMQYLVNPSCHAVYVEYMNNGNTGLKVALGYYRRLKDTGSIPGSPLIQRFDLPTTSAVKKMIIFLPSQTQASTDFQKYNFLGSFFEVTSAIADGSWRLQKVILGEINHAPTEKRAGGETSTYTDFNNITKGRMGAFEIMTDSPTIADSVAVGATILYDYTFPIPFTTNCSFVTIIDYGSNVLFQFNAHNLTKTGCQIAIKNTSAVATAPGKVGVMAIGV